MENEQQAALAAVAATALGKAAGLVLAGLWLQNPLKQSGRAERRIAVPDVLELLRFGFSGSTR